MSVGLSNGDISPAPSPHQMPFRDQLDSFRQSDAAREQLMHRLLDDNARLTREVHEARDDLRSEQMARRQWQSRAGAHGAELHNLRSQMDCDPFALALIDGDGCIFQDLLLRSGADGGAEAAHKLNLEIKKLLQQRQGSEDSPSSAIRGSIVVHIYASFDDLAKKLASVGLLHNPGDFAAFARAFSLNQPLFNFIDVGRGKERADWKIKELFRLFVHNSHCKHIIFGGCHDNGYLLDLEPYRRDQDVAKRITLLETTNAEWQYKSLGFPIVKFDSVFRDQPLPDGRAQYFPDQGSAPAHPPGLAADSNNVFSTPQAATRALPQRSLSIQPQAQGARASLPTPTATPTANEPTKHPQSLLPRSPALSPGGNPSYANVGGQADRKTISIAPAKPHVRKFAMFNAAQQRIDEKLPRVDQGSLQARVMQYGKLCNGFHLVGYCKNGSACPYSHEPPLSDTQRIGLRIRARTTPCGYGSQCADASCLSGHLCPKDNDCQNESCKFVDMHGIDQRPAMKVYEDETVEILT